jgi:hypothetical protein
VDFLCFLTSSFAVSFEGCVFCLFYHNSFFNILKEYPDYLLLFAFAVVQRWVLSVERCQTQTVVPKFMAIPFSGGDLKKLILSKRTEQIESQNN